MTTYPAPTITPVEARALFGSDLSQEVFHGDHRFTMDGPMMTPSEFWAPQAETPDGFVYYVTGEPGQPIEGQTWTEAFEI